MRLNLPKVKFSMRLVLTLVFLGVLLFEAYLGYKYFRPGFFDEPIEVPEGSVVRVNRSYQETVEYLERMYGYQPDNLQLPRPNPF
jgi:hypothetical protein